VTTLRALGQNSTNTHRTGSNPKLRWHLKVQLFWLTYPNTSAMNVDQILQTLNEQAIDYLLIGGMNFLIRHLPELTFDVDVWVKDVPDNLERLNQALIVLQAEWGRTESEWKPVPTNWSWLQRQPVFCLTTAHGALDVFREVLGLEGQYLVCKARAVASQTASGVHFLGLSDQDMLACQQALPPGDSQRRPEMSGPDRDSLRLKEIEERKREAAYEPAKRWQHIQQTITWAEANLAPELRRNRPRTPRSLKRLAAPGSD
jgi:hypothetical protein